MIQKEDKYFILDFPRDLNLRYYVRELRKNLKLPFLRWKLERLIPNDPGEKKYNVSVCAIFRNEAPYLKEWIEFHKIVGVEHFYIYNNFSDDNYKEVLSPYVKDGTLDLIEWPYEQGQMKAYQDCLTKYSEQTKWIGFIDLDEFVVPVKYDSIYEFLRKFEKNRPSVLMYWRLFGTSGKLDRDRNTLITEEFTSCWPKYDTVGKCFFNTKYQYELDGKYNTDMHAFWGKCNGVFLPPVNFEDQMVVGERNIVHTDDFPIQINHYFTKTYQEYLEKVSRGDAFFALNPRNEAYFYRHDMLCTGHETKIYKYLIKLKLAMKGNKKV